MKKGWQLVYSTGQTHLAEIMKSVLHDQGIETFVVDKRDSSYVALGEIEFYVRDEDAILARIIAQQMNNE